MSLRATRYEMILLIHSKRQSSSISAQQKLMMLDMESYIAGVGVVKTVHWKVMMTPPGELMRLSLSLLTLLRNLMTSTLR